MAKRTLVHFLEKLKDLVASRSASTSPLFVQGAAGARAGRGNAAAVTAVMAGDELRCVSW